MFRSIHSGWNSSAAEAPFRPEWFWDGKKLSGYRLRKRWRLQLRSLRVRPRGLPRAARSFRCSLRLISLVGRLETGLEAASRLNTRAHLVFSQFLDRFRTDPTPV